MNKGFTQLLLTAIFIALIWLLLPTGSIHAKLNYIGVPAIANPYFADVRAVISGILCFKDGIDPYISGACLSYDANWAYPRAWFLLSFLPISYAWVIYIGFFNILFFIAWILYLGKNLSNGAYLLLLFACCSSAVLFCLERGNADLLILQLIVGAFLLKRQKEWGFSLSIVLLLIASLLKIYPIVLLVLYINDITNRKKLIQVIVAALLFIVYLLVFRADFIVITQLAPSFTGISFGIGVLPKFLMEINKWVWLSQNFKWIWCLVAISTLLFAVKEQLKTTLKTSEISNEKTWYLVGAIIYLFNYLIGFQVDYRLLFLVLCLPSLLMRIGLVSNLVQLLLIFMVLWGNAITMWLNYLQSNVPISMGVYRPNVHFTIIEESAHAILSWILIYQLLKYFIPRLKVLFTHYFGRQTT